MPIDRDIRIEMSTPEALRFAYWGVLGLGVIFVLVGLSGGELGYLLAACFFGIVARVVQAEYQHRGRAG